jgi:hypothetical protein
VFGGGQVPAGPVVPAARAEIGVLERLEEQNGPLPSGVSAIVTTTVITTIITGPAIVPGRSPAVIPNGLAGVISTGVTARISTGISRPHFLGSIVGVTGVFGGFYASLAGGQ